MGSNKKERVHDDDADAKDFVDSTSDAPLGGSTPSARRRLRSKVAMAPASATSVTSVTSVCMPQRVCDVAPPPLMSLAVTPRLKLSRVKEEDADSDNEREAGPTAATMRQAQQLIRNLRTPVEANGDGAPPSKARALHTRLAARKRATPAMDSEVAAAETVRGQPKPKKTRQARLPEDEEIGLLLEEAEQNVA